MTIGRIRRKRSLNILRTTHTDCVPSERYIHALLFNVVMCFFLKQRRHIEAEFDKRNKHPLQISPLPFELAPLLLTQKIK